MPKEFPRAARLNAQLQQELSELLRGGVLHDPRLQGVDLTVTAVDVVRDLSHAHVLVSSLGESEPLEEAVRGLNRAAGKLRHELGRRLRMRYVPELSFRADVGLREADHVNRLLRQALDQDRLYSTTPDKKPE
jgi:ribosome-binding factor A